MLPVCSMRACSTMESTLWLVTNAAVADLQAMNRKLLEDCRADENRARPPYENTATDGEGAFAALEYRALRSGQTAIPDQESGNKASAVVERFIGVN